MVPQRDLEPTARAFAARFLEASFADAVDRMTDDGREAVVAAFPAAFGEDVTDAEAALEAYWWGLHGQYGSPTGVGQVTVDGGAPAVTLEFEAGVETATVDVGEQGVTGIAFDPAYRPPEYIDPEAFTERAVSVAAGDVTLDGVLAVPEGEGPFPGVVLVHGAGVHDPDGTVGAAKPLRDLAQGIASRGVATLRYEKRLAVQDVPDEAFTVDRVVTDDAVAAVDRLAAADTVDGEQVFVAGHSQGGMCAPRIAAHHGDVAGVLVLDGRADSMHDPEDLRFLRYEFERDGDLSEEQATRLEEERETVRRIAEGEYDDDEPLWGRPGTWHRSLRGYDPAGTAAELSVPVFVAKSGRADPETQAELLAWLREQEQRWRAVDLPGGSRVEFYGDVDHFLQPGFAPTGPVSLYFGGNVSEDVVSDIAAWVHDVTDG